MIGWRHVIYVEGYDPQGAVTLQETFVRLSEGRSSSWLEGLFASHPPSEERVAKNRETVAQLGAGGDLGTERYQAKLAPLRQIEPAYEKYDQALAAMQKKDVATAKSLAGKAPLRASIPATARTLWSLSGPELYVLHVDGAGVSSAAYQRWLADLLVAAVLAP